MATKSSRSKARERNLSGPLRRRAFRYLSGAVPYPLVPKTGVVRMAPHATAYINGCEPAYRQAGCRPSTIDVGGVFTQPRWSIVHGPPGPGIKNPESVNGLQGSPHTTAESNYGIRSHPSATQPTETRIKESRIKNKHPKSDI